MIFDPVCTSEMEAISFGSDRKIFCFYTGLDPTGSVLILTYVLQ